MAIFAGPVDAGDDACVLNIDFLNPQSYSSGSVANSLVSDETYTMYNGAAVTNNLLVCDGTNDYMGISQQLSIANDFTMEFWAMPTATHEIDTQSTSGTSGISGQKWLLYSSSDSGTLISVGTNGISVYEHAGSYLPALLVYSGTISSTQLSHIVVVYNNRTSMLYLNGTYIKTGYTSARNPIYCRMLQVGGGSYGAFAGSVGMVRAYNRVLTADEIALNYTVFRNRYQ